MYGYDQNVGAQQQYAPPQQPMAGGYGQQQPLYPEPSPPSLADAVRAFLDASRADAVTCANDRTAGQLMQTLLRLGYTVPRDIRLAGVDDAEIARLLPVPLSTVRQPTREIGDAALAAMLQRIERPSLPTRDILLHCDLVVRESCGAPRKPQ